MMNWSVTYHHISLTTDPREIGFDLSGLLISDVRSDNPDIVEDHANSVCHEQNVREISKVLFKAIKDLIVLKVPV